MTVIYKQAAYGKGRQVPSARHKFNKNDYIHFPHYYNNFCGYPHWKIGVETKDYRYMCVLIKFHFSNCEHATL